MVKLTVSQQKGLSVSTPSGDMASLTAENRYSVLSHKRSDYVIRKSFILASKHKEKRIFFLDENMNLQVLGY